MRNWILVLPLLLTLCACECVHDQFIKDTQKHFFNDLNDKRFLQAPTIGPLRTFLDFSQVTQGSLQDKLIIKHCMDIVAAYFYNTLQVPRLPQLFYPNDAPLQCNLLTIPSSYRTAGVNADIAIVVGNQNSTSAVYAAKSTACAFLKSNNRPIWGMVLWNIAQFNNKYDTVSFQQLVSIGMHQVIHVLAFSALMYDLYPKGSPLVGNVNTQNRLSFPRMNFQISKHYGCNNSNGLGLQDQDGTLISSHWQKHHIGNQIMIASTQKNSHLSVFTLTLFEYTGWYYNVSYQYAEKDVWGKNKGCAFLNVDNCEFDEFCTGSNFDCTYQGKQIGRCLTDFFTGGCKIYKYYTNTICNHQKYQLLNLNANLEAQQRGGYYSSCFRSDLRKVNKTANVLNNRCYLSICFNNVIYILIGRQYRICSSSNQVIAAPAGLQGILTCPSDINNYCKSKANCAYNCNSNGICIDGLCLCTGSTVLTQTCTYPSYSSDTIGNTGGRLLFQVNQQIPDKPKKSLRQVEQFLQCPIGKIFDPITIKCQSCQLLLGCSQCNVHGCIIVTDSEKLK